MPQKKFRVIQGDGKNFRESIGREILNSIVKRDDAEYDRLNRILHPEVILSVCENEAQTAQHEQPVPRHTS